MEKNIEELGEVSKCHSIAHVVFDNNNKSTWSDINNNSTWSDNINHLRWSEKHSPSMERCGEGKGAETVCVAGSWFPPPTTCREDSDE